MRFSRRWQSLRLEQLVREDIRDLTQIQQLDQLELLVKLLSARSAHQLIYGNLASDVRVSIDTTRRWIDVLVSLHLGFLIRPWFKNVSRSLRKEPKWFLRDWASIKNQDDKAETFIACHLLKAVAPFAFQVVLDANYVDADCFTSASGPIVVPAQTFLSQLL